MHSYDGFLFLILAVIIGLMVNTIRVHKQLEEEYEKECKRRVQSKD